LPSPRGRTIDQVRPGEPVGDFMPHLLPGHAADPDCAMVC
jgi:hypothetical protein